MSRLRLKPRRFHYFMEFSRQGGEAAGTSEQQDLLRSMLKEAAPYGSRYDRVLHRLSRHMKQEVKFASIQFDEIHLGRKRYHGLAGRWRITLTTLWGGDSHSMAWWEQVLHHEIGHWVGIHFFNPQNRTETWANKFAWWVISGQPDHSVWDEMKELLPHRQRVLEYKRGIHE